MKKLKSFPPPDLASLDIYGLWCVASLYERLIDAAASALNEPRWLGPARDHADELWGEHFHPVYEAIYKEVRSRKPTTLLEVEFRAATIVRYLSMIDDLDAMAAAVQEAVTQRVSMKVAA